MIRRNDFFFVFIYMRATSRRYIYMDGMVGFGSIATAYMLEKENSHRYWSPRFEFDVWFFIIGACYLPGVLGVGQTKKRG